MDDNWLKSLRKTHCLLQQPTVWLNCCLIWERRKTIKSRNDTHYHYHYHLLKVKLGLARGDDDDWVVWLLLEDAVGDDVELRRGDGALGVGGGGGDHQGGGGGHGGRDGLAHTELSAEVGVVITETGHQPPNLPPHFPPHQLLILAGIVEVNPHPVTPALPPASPDEEADDGEDHEENHHGHRDDDDEEGRGGGLSRDWKNIEVGAGGHEGEEVPVLILLVEAGDLIEISDCAPVKRVESLGDPVTVLLAGALPPVVVESHRVQAGPHAQVQLGEMVVVQGDGRQLRQRLEHCRAQPVEFVVVQIQQFQGLQAGQLLRLNLLNFVVTEVEGSQGWQTEKRSVAQTWNMKSEKLPNMETKYSMEFWPGMELEF